MVRPYEPVDVATVLAQADRARKRSKQTETARAEGKWGVGPSDVGRCRRSIMYRERPPADLVEVPAPIDDKLAAYVGTMVHDGIARTLRRRRRNVAVEIDVAVPGFDVPGHADLWEPRIGRVTDWKVTGSEWAWEQLARGPFANDIDQGMLYGLGLTLAGEKVEVVRIVYVRTFSSPATRNTPRTEAFEVPYDHERALHAAEWLHAVIDALDAGFELPRDRPGPELDGICRQCPFRAHCWELDAAEEAGRTPYGWMTTRDDPDIEVALVDYDQARAEESKAKNVKTQIRNALDGVTPGRYGSFTIDFGRKNTTWEPDDAAYARVLAAEIDAARAENRPPRPVSEIDVPTKPKTTGGAIAVKPVRAAQLAAEGVVPTVVDGDGDAQ